MMTGLRALGFSVVAGFLLGGCLGETPTAYDPAQFGQMQISQAERELAADIPEASDRLVVTGRLWKNRKIYRNVDRVKPSVGWGVDAIVEFDLRPNLPLYRVKLRPLNHQPSAIVEGGSRNFSLTAAVSSNNGSEFEMYLKAPIVAQNGHAGSFIDKRGQVVTPWIYCPSCLTGSAAGNANEKNWLADRVEILRSLKSGALVQLDKLDYRYRKFDFTGKIGPKAQAQAAAYDFYNGMSREQFEIARKQRVLEKRRISAANSSYSEFINQTYRPLTLKGYIESQPGCLDIAYYKERDPYGFRDQNRKVIRDNNRFIQCYQQGIPGYDFAAYEAIHPDLKAREAELWGKTDKTQKRHDISSGSAQLTQAGRRVEAAAYGADDARAGIIETNRRIARDKARQQALQNLFAANQRIINQQRDNRMIFRPDGTFTTPAQHRRASTAAFEAAKRKLAAQRSASASSSGTAASGGSAGQRNGTTSGTRTAAETSQASAPTSTVFLAESHTSRSAVGRTIQACHGTRATCRLVSVTPLHRVQSFCLGYGDRTGSEGIRNAIYVNVWEIPGVTSDETARLERSSNNQPPRAGIGDGHLTVEQPVLRYWLNRKDSEGRTSYFQTPEEAEADSLRICGSNSSFSWGKT